MACVKGTVTSTVVTGGVEVLNLSEQSLPQPTNYDATLAGVRAVHESMMTFFAPLTKAEGNNNAVKPFEAVPLADEDGTGGETTGGRDTARLAAEQAAAEECSLDLDVGQPTFKSQRTEDEM